MQHSAAMLSGSGIGSLLAYSSPPHAMFVSFAVPSGVHTRSYVAVLGVAVERKGECEEGQQLVTEVGRPSDGYVALCAWCQPSTSAWLLRVRASKEQREADRSEDARVEPSLLFRHF